MSANGMNVAVGPEGQVTPTFGAGNVTAAGGNMYFKVGESLAVGTDGSTFVKCGPALFGNDGQARIVLGYKPKFVL